MSNFSYGHTVFNFIYLLLGFFRFLPLCFQSRLLQICCIWERVKLTFTFPFFLRCFESIFDSRNPHQVLSILSHIQQIFGRQLCAKIWTISINPFPHIDAFWRLCSRQLFENIATKEEIAQNKQFLLLPQRFPLLVIGYPFNYRDILFFDKICSKSSAAELSYEGKG